MREQADFEGLVPSCVGWMISMECWLDSGPSGAGRDRSGKFFVKMGCYVYICDRMSKRREVFAVVATA